MSAFEIILAVLLLAVTAAAVFAMRHAGRLILKLAESEARELERVGSIATLQTYAEAKDRDRVFVIGEIHKHEEELKKDLAAAQEQLRISIDAREDWEKNFQRGREMLITERETWLKQEEFLFAKIAAQDKKYSPEQIALLEMIGFIVQTTAQDWTASDAKWLKNTFGTGHGFKFRELVKNVSNNYMIHAVSNPPEGTREWRGGVAMGFRSLLSLFEIYENDQQFSDPSPALTELAKDRQPPAPNGSSAAMERARFTP